MSLLKIHANRNSLFHCSNHGYYLLFIILYIFMSKMKMIVSKCMKFKSSLEVFFFSVFPNTSASKSTGLLIRKFSVFQNKEK